MPGLSICLSRKPITDARRTVLREAAASMLHFPRYDSKSVLMEPYIDVRFTAYNGYPSLFEERQDIAVFVEGAIYNKCDIQVLQELHELGVQLQRNSPHLIKSARRWNLESDGEFIVVIYDRMTGNFALITDALGRLPLFQFGTESQCEILLSREPKYTISTSGSNRLDRIGIGQFLMQGYNLGSRTMSEGVTRVAPATIIVFDGGQRGSQTLPLHSWNVGFEINESLKFEDHVECVSTLLCRATRDRVLNARCQNVSLALSGGLDSRAILSALIHERLPFTAHTCLDRDAGNSKDVRIAKSIASEIQFPWTEFRLNEPSLEDYLTIVRHQEGGSVTWMAAAIQHYQMLNTALVAQATLFTGDGGGNVMYPFLAASPVRSIDDIMRQTFDTVYYWDLPSTEKLLRLKSGELRDTARHEFECYPERSMEWKYAHHKFLGRPYRFIMEGEDRTRFYYWLGTPFWSLPLVSALLAVPECHKKHFKLYTAVLKRILPASVRIPYAATLVNVSFPLLTVYSHGNTFIKSRPALYRSLRTLLVRGKDPNFNHAGLDLTMRRIIDDSHLVSEYFDVARLKQHLNTGMPKMSYHLLATVLLKIGLLDAGYARD